MSENPLVSIITINYNNVDVTCELLASLRKLSYPNHEVIVVDNASKESPFEKITTLYPEATLIMSEENLGFAGGNNLGVKNAKGDYLFFVNNDTELHPDCIQPLITRFESNDKIGIISPKIKYFDDREIIQYAGFSKINPYTARNYGIGSMEKDLGQHDAAGFTHYAHGAAMMTKKQIIKDVGLMNEGFFLYYEELDWCEAMKRNGYKIFYEPKSLIFHKESFTIGKNSKLKTYYITRNRILFMKRNFPGFQFGVFLLFFFCVSFPKNLLSFIKNGEMDNIQPFIKGIVWNIKN